MWEIVKFYDESWEIKIISYKMLIIEKLASKLQKKENETPDIYTYLIWFGVYPFKQDYEKMQSFSFSFFYLFEKLQIFFSINSSNKL